jgi:hypothetical protein
MSRISNLDYLRNIPSGTASLTNKSTFNFRFPIMKTLELRLLDVGDSTASLEMEAKTEWHSNPMGTIHGGVLCDIANAMRNLPGYITRITPTRFAGVGPWSSAGAE